MTSTATVTINPIMTSIIVLCRTKFFIVHDNQESEQAMITDNRKEFEVCSGALGAKISGVELCGQLHFPNASMLTRGPYFPLTGPSAISIALHKRDSHTGYKLLAKRVEVSDVCVFNSCIVLTLCLPIATTSDVTNTSLLTVTANNLLVWNRGGCAGWK